MFRIQFAAIATVFGLAAGSANAGHLGVSALDQDVSGGTVTAASVLAETNGWMVVHRTGDDSKPAILTEPVSSGQKLMLMLHGEAGGSKAGIFEYTLGAKEDGPIKADGKLIMAVITAK